MIKVLQINMIYKEKSTGRTCLELDNYLNQHGMVSTTAYGWGSKYEGAYRINTYPEYYFHNIMSRITGLEGYFSFFSTLRLIRFMNRYKPDIVHLRNIHGHFLNYPILFRYLSKNNVKTIIHVHDCWCFTGKCTHYTVIHCDKWKSDCKGCPKQKEYPISYFWDNAEFMLKQKKKWFGSLKNLVVVGNSNWTAGEAAKSFLGNRRIERVYNWIDLDVFQYRKSDVLNKIRLDSDRFIIIGVSAGWVPGSPRYDDFVSLANMVSDDYQIVLVGGKAGTFNHNKIMHIPFTSNTVELAELYSAAGVYVHFSLEDTFGKVIAEAQACGTPAIVYGITGCKELVNDGITGHVAEPRNVEQVYAYIQMIRENGKEKYRQAAADWARESFSLEKNCNQMMSIYKSM